MFILRAIIVRQTFKTLCFDVNWRHEHKHQSGEEQNRKKIYIEEPFFYFYNDDEDERQTKRAGRLIHMLMPYALFVM